MSFFRPTEFEFTRLFPTEAFVFFLFVFFAFRREPTVFERRLLATVLFFDFFLSFFFCSYWIVVVSYFSNHAFLKVSDLVYHHLLASSQFVTLLASALVSALLYHQAHPKVQELRYEGTLSQWVTRIF